MTGISNVRATDLLDLDGRALLIPGLQPEPLPIRAVAPAPCTQACPAGINVKAYVSLIAEGRFAESLEVVRRHCPLPGVCGRICHAPCEAACTRGDTDEPLAIRSLKRFVADYGLDNPPVAPGPMEERTQRVAVIGSGPAGLAAAYDLRLAGYPVTVFEAESDPGGMLRYGIASYRLPRDVLSAEIEALCSAGIEVRTGCRVGQDIELEQLLGNGYAAALFAVGAQLGRRLGIPEEEECSGVEDALSFLRRVNEGDRTPVEGRVVVIGGGSTAVEAARSALRLGAESVQILYRRYREEVLAADEEIEAAEAEGVTFQFLVAPTRVLREGDGLRALECIKVGLGEPDASGRRSPIQIPGSEFIVETDRVLAAVGQRADLDFVDEDVLSRLAERGRLRVDAGTSMTGLQGVFGAGDVVTGPATVIEAIAGGHRAAASIRRYLEEGIPERRDEEPEELAAAVEYELLDPTPMGSPRVRPELVWPAPSREFFEVEQAYSVEAAVAEARRCLRCGPCSACSICAPSCARRHIVLRRSGESEGPSAAAVLRAPSGVALNLNGKSPSAAQLLPAPGPRPGPADRPLAGEPVELLPARVWVQADRCRGCERCVEVCAFEAISVTDDADGEGTAAVDAALCRGCSLCTAVCPTDAAIHLALSPEWWQMRLDEIAAAPDPTYVVLSCENRAPALEESIGERDLQVEVVRLRCVGQLDAGMLLELYLRQPQGILVAGCLGDRCRFGSGARLAGLQVERARSMLEFLGVDAGRITSDWSGDRTGDPLTQPVMRLVTANPTVAADGAASGGR